MIRDNSFVGGRGGSIRASAFRPGRRLLLTSVIVAVTGAAAWSTAHAGPLEDAAKAAELQAAIDGLATSTDDKISESVTKLGALDDPRAIPALDGRPVSSVLGSAVADVAALRRRSPAAIGGGEVVRLAARAGRSHDRR